MEPGVPTLSKKQKRRFLLRNRNIRPLPAIFYGHLRLGHNMHSSHPLQVLPNYPLLEAQTASQARPGSRAPSQDMGGSILRTKGNWVEILWTCGNVRYIPSNIGLISVKPTLLGVLSRFSDKLSAQLEVRRFLVTVIRYIACAISSFQWLVLITELANSWRIL